MKQWKTWNQNDLLFQNHEDVHIFLIPLGPNQSLERARTLLTPDEKARAARFKIERARRQFVLTRASLRWLLTAYTGLQNPQIQFVNNDFGKPFLLNLTSPPIYFNVSHSQEWALIGLCAKHDLGIDIEFMPPDFDGLHLAERFFSANEVKQLHQLPVNEQKEGFFNAWTRKEAYIKAVGKGLSIPLSGFSVTLAPHLPARLLETSHQPELAQQFTLADLPVPPDYKGAVVVKAEQINLRLFDGSTLPVFND